MSVFSFFVFCLFVFVFLFFAFQFIEEKLYIQAQRLSLRVPKHLQTRYSRGKNLYMLDGLMKLKHVPSPKWNSYKSFL